MSISISPSHPAHFQAQFSLFFSFAFIISLIGVCLLCVLFGGLQSDGALALDSCARASCVQHARAHTTQGYE